jgi:hypothetical protein
MPTPIHRGAGRLLAWALALSTLGSCEWVGLDPGAQYLCRAQTDCASGTRCDVASSLCEPAVDASVAPASDAAVLHDAGPVEPSADASAPLDASVMDDGGRVRPDARAAHDDAGRPETPDAGQPDGGGAPDVGTPDVGDRDGGVPDVGTPDAGPAHCDVYVGCPSPAQTCCYATSTCYDQAAGERCDKVTCDNGRTCPAPLQCCASDSLCYDPQAGQGCGVVVEVCADGTVCGAPRKCCAGTGKCYDPLAEDCLTPQKCTTDIQCAPQLCCLLTGSCYDPMNGLCGVADPCGGLCTKLGLACCASDKSCYDLVRCPTCCGSGS